MAKAKPKLPFPGAKPFTKKGTGKKTAPAATTKKKSPKK